ncbi:response regulator transcription factor [Sinorhizobium meliloti]|uniref:response regulator transcription factor n=1 Tax=Rhizobium meliloti TaxID=382 RepID=UPI000EFA44D3|nr:response regulator transcription factor [Sinorhizobium meliloti]RMI15017.1 DNA-binding response regulator [Sinorhizobium meliloti]
MRILLIEDDEAIGSAVREHTVADGHAVDWAKDFARARDYESVVSYELILLDIHLPGGCGVGYLREMSKRADPLPVIVLTAREQISDRIEALNAGADDYLAKPFNLGELSARIHIHAVARRHGHFPGPIYSLGTVVICSAERRVDRAGQGVYLTAREWAVLDCLLSRPGRVISKEKIQDALHSFGSEMEGNTVEVYVSRIRKKIGGDLIAAVRGFGYRLVVI